MSKKWPNKNLDLNIATFKHFDGGIFYNFWLTGFGFGFELFCNFLINFETADCCTEVFGWAKFLNPSVLYIAFFKCWALTMTSDRSLLSYASCHQNNRIDLNLLSFCAVTNVLCTVQATYFLIHVVVQKVGAVSSNHTSNHSRYYQQSAETLWQPSIKSPVWVGTAELQCTPQLKHETTKDLNQLQTHPSISTKRT